jgi:hypothetical protein
VPFHVPVAAWANCGAKNPDKRMEIPRDGTSVATPEVWISFFIGGLVGGILRLLTMSTTSHAEAR